MSDAVSPKHYEFNGVQLLSISRQLTSNGGQAVQYIARSTRTDGNNKHSDSAGHLEDLLKAQVFLNDEIDRLREAQSQETQDEGARVFHSYDEIPDDVDAIQIPRMRFRTAFRVRSRENRWWRAPSREQALEEVGKYTEEGWPLTGDDFPVVEVTA